MTTTPYTTVTALALAQTETDAAAQNIKVSALALDRDYPPEFCALAAALDSAIEKEQMAEMYDIAELREKALLLRQAVTNLAVIFDASREVPVG